AHISGLTKLRRLDLLGSIVTDAGLIHLQKMTDLEELNLYRTKVSNAGLAQLAPLKRLRALDLRYSRVTSSAIDAGKARLRNRTVLAAETVARGSRRTSDMASVAGRGEDAAASWLQSLGAQVERRDGHVAGLSLRSTPIVDRELAILSE